MKKLTIEEKAKRYDKAIERARNLYNSEETSAEVMIACENIFPELIIEYEDKRSKKWILEYLYDGLRKSDEQFKDHFKTAIAWLEKQGEQKPFNYESTNIQQKDFAPKVDMPRYSIGDVICDKSCTTLNKDMQPNVEIVDIRNGMYICNKVSFPIYRQDEYELVTKKIDQKPTNNVVPKFRVGDWITNGLANPEQIISIEDDMYYTHSSIDNDIELGGDIESMDKEYHLWTIKDAKDGDVLYDGNNACLFRKKMKDDSAIWIDAYCGINSDGMFNVNDEDECWCLASDCVPATKEQRDLLFQKIKEEGYKFDFNKKELKKIK